MDATKPFTIAKQHSCKGLQNGSRGYLFTGS